jgi:hypothetical protein
MENMQKTPDVLPAEVRLLLTAMEARSGQYVLAMRRDAELLSSLLEKHFGQSAAFEVERRLLAKLDGQLTALYSPPVVTESGVVKRDGGGVVLDLVEEVELTAVEDEQRTLLLENERAA